MNGIRLNETRSCNPSALPQALRKTRESVLELELVPGSEDELVVVRERRRACLHAEQARARARGRDPGPRAVVSWPMATVARIALPPRARASGS